MGESETDQDVSVLLDAEIEGASDRPVAGIYDIVHTGWRSVNYYDS